MCALSANAPIVHELGDYNSIPAGADEIVYEGSMIGESDGTSGQVSAGYGEALVVGDTFVGHSRDKVDNTGGSDGDKDIRVLSGRYRLEVTLTSVAITDVGSAVYASDDVTLTLTPNASPVGVIIRYVASNTCVVEFRTTP